MVFALLLTLIAIAGGAVATYLYDDDSPLAIRLCAGACIGLVVFGLSGFLWAMIFGLTPFSVGLAGVVVALPLLLLLKPERRIAVIADFNRTRQWVRRAVLHPNFASTGTLLFFAGLAILMWCVFDRVMFERDGGIFTGELNNFGDLPFHLSVITSFAKGNNFPPEDPTYAGAKFTYPFIVDLVSAMYVRVGTSLRDSMFIENFVLAVSTVGLLYRFGLVLTRDRLAAIITPLLVIFSGGLGFYKIFSDTENSGNGIFSLLWHLPRTEYTIVPSGTLRWGNAISALLLPQRSLLMGLPIALIVFIEWWKQRQASHGKRGNEEEGNWESRKPAAIKQRKKVKVKAKPTGAAVEIPSAAGSTESPSSRFPFFPYASLPLPPGARSMFAAGLIAGLLPLVHAHTFVSVMVVGLFQAIIGGKKLLPNWFLFFLGASLVGGPQMLWAALGSSVKTSTFLGWEIGWDHGDNNVLLFWLNNTGLFIPLIIAALTWRGKEPIIPKRMLLFYLPFTLCFIIPNAVKLAPWIWDNIKVLFYWWVASAPIVALLLAKLFRRGPAWKIISAAAFVCLTLAGALDVWRIASRQEEVQIFDREGIEFARMVEAITPPKAMILHATTHNNPMFLTGRRSIMGYPGHIWTHGLDPSSRLRDIRAIYAGDSDADSLINHYGIDYVVVSGIENAETTVNDLFFEKRFTRVGQIGDYRLYKVAPQ